MSRKRPKLGQKGRDRVTGFEGTVIGVARRLGVRGRILTLQHSNGKKRAVPGGRVELAECDC